MPYSTSYFPFQIIINIQLFLKFDSDKIARALSYCNVTNDLDEWPQNTFLGFGNSFTSNPLQKVTAGKKHFEEIVKKKNQSKDELVRNLMDLLCNREKHWPDDELHRRAPSWSESLLVFNRFLFIFFHMNHSFF